MEMGLLGFGVVAWYLIVLFRRAGGKIRNWSSEVGGAVTLACMLGITGILVHSAVDFNLEIPANAALFYVLCTVAASELPPPRPPPAGICLMICRFAPRLVPVWRCSRRA